MQSQGVISRSTFFQFHQEGVGGYKFETTTHIKHADRLGGK